MLELLKFLNKNMMDDNLVPLKIVIQGIKSREAVAVVSDYLKELSAPNLKKLRTEKATEEDFEIYFLLLELSESLTLSMFDQKILKRSVKMCKKAVSIYPVYSSHNTELILVAMQFTAAGSNRSKQSRSRQGCPEKFAVHIQAINIGHGNR